MWSYSVFPVTLMLFLQYKTSINPLIKASVFSAIGSFIIQPIAKLLDLYHPKQWSNYYSFIILFVIYLFANFVATRSSFDKISENK